VLSLGLGGSRGASDGAVDLGIVRIKSSRIVRKDLPSTRGSQDGQVLRQLDKVREPSGYTTLRQSWTKAVRTSSLTILRCLENSSRHNLDPTNRIIYHLRSLKSTVISHRNLERIYCSIGRLYCVGNKRTLLDENRWVSTLRTTTSGRATDPLPRVRTPTSSCWSRFVHRESTDGAGKESGKTWTES
jgi:hypothetical protein